MLIQETCDAYGMEKALDAIESALERYGLDKKERTRSRLLCEEVMASLVSHANKSAKHFRVRVRSWLGEIAVEISAPGLEYEFSKSIEVGANLDMNGLDNNVEDAIRSMILKSFATDLRYHNQDGVNFVRMTLVKSGRKQLYITLVSMLLAIVIGMAMSAFSPEAINRFLDENIFSSIKTMFMNSLKIVVAPVVFFSIVSAFGEFCNLYDVGKIGGKFLALYMIASMIATAIGVAIGYFAEPGSKIFISAITNTQQNMMGISIKEMIVGIVPDNFFSPFLECNTLQLIFLASVCGIATSMVGSRSKSIWDFFTISRDFFLKLTSILIKCLPIAVFCSMLSLVLSTGSETLLPVIKICLLFVAGLVLLMLAYVLLLIFFTRLNPIPFVKKYSSVMLQVASSASSNASLPLNMAICEKKLGISPKVYSLSLPLGSTLNMGGKCVYLGIASLALAKLYGVDIASTDLLMIATSIIFLSVGTPGLVSLSLLLAQLNVPIEAVGLVMGIDPILEMLRTMVNCFGDIAISTVVAKSNNMLNKNVYDNI